MSAELYFDWRKEKSLTEPEGWNWFSFDNLETTNACLVLIIKTTNVIYIDSSVFWWVILFVPQYLEKKPETAICG